MGANFDIIRAEFTGVCQQRQPNGQVFTMLGYGECSKEERGNSNKGHNIVATAFTRMLNRAISDLIGFGEVSAEEIEDPKDLDLVDGEAHEVKATPEMDAKELASTKADPEPTTPLNSLPAELKMLKATIGACGYNPAKATVEQGLSQLVNTKKTKLAQLTSREGNLLAGYLNLQKGIKDPDELKKAKSLGKEVLKRCMASDETWEQGYAWTKQSTTPPLPAPAAPVTELAKAL